MLRAKSICTTALCCLYATHLLFSAHLTIIQMNDVYETGAVYQGTAGGVARIATVKKQLQEKGQHVMILHAGDMLSPSAMGQVVVDGQALNGKQMVAALNALGINYATFGNHEFDLKHDDFVQRIKESQFPWISSNALYTGQETLANVKRFAIEAVDTGPGYEKIRVGIFAITTAVNTPAYMQFLPPLETAKEMVELLRPQCDLLIGITHQDMHEDIELCQKIQGIDLIVGGHEHINQLVYRGQNFTPIAKADANAISIYRHDILWDESAKRLTIDSDIHKLDERTALDEATQAVVKEWENKAMDGLKKMGFEPRKEIAKLVETLDGTEDCVRFKSNALTRLLSQALMHDWPQADLSLYNAGSIRIDDTLTPGPLTEYDIFRILPFESQAMLVQVRGDTLQKVLRVGATSAGQGSFIQTSPNVLAIGSLPDALEWSVNNKPIEATSNYLVALNGFVISGKEPNLAFFKPGEAGVGEPTLGRDWRKLVIETVLEGFFANN